MIITAFPNLKRFLIWISSNILYVHITDRKSFKLTQGFRKGCFFKPLVAGQSHIWAISIYCNALLLENCSVQDLFIFKLFLENHALNFF
jgi:hypothetical protein